jgi:hypothetical protein
VYGQSNATQLLGLGCYFSVFVVGGEFGIYLVLEKIHFLMTATI